MNPIRFVNGSKIYYDEDAASDPWPYWAAIYYLKAKMRTGVNVEQIGPQAIPARALRLIVAANYRNEDIEHRPGRNPREDYFLEGVQRAVERTAARASIDSFAEPTPVWRLKLRALVLQLLQRKGGTQ